MAARILEANQGPVDLRIYNVERDLIYLPLEGRSKCKLQPFDGVELVLTVSM
jgi:hypothetical protein